MDAARYFLSILIVIAALYGLLFVLRRKGIVHGGSTFRRTGSRRRVEVLERAALTSGHSLHLVRFMNGAILIAVSPAGCTVLQTTSCAELACNNVPATAAEADRGLGA